MAANNDENVAMLMSMGFDRGQAAHALNDCGSLEMAINSLLSGSVGGGCGGINDHQYDATTAAAQSHGDIRAVHSEMSQYSDSVGRSACTSIALTMACNLLKMPTTDPEGVIDSSFLINSIQEGIKMYSDISSNSNGVEHSSVEELLTSCHSADNKNSTAKQIISSLKQFNFSPRQGILSNSSDNPMGLEAVLSQCQADATDSESYIAVVITKPPETVLVLLSPRSGQSSSKFILLDSHPRPQQLSPHHPSGSYALFHSTLTSLVESLKQIFPVTELGSDVPEMMAMMYNSFDAYPFQYQR